MKRKLHVSLLIAVLIALFMAAVTFAAVAKWGLLDFFRLYDQPIQPMPSAKEMISSNLGSDRNDKLRMTVREAVYDGTNVRAIIEIAPQEGSNLLLVDPWTSAELDLGGAGDASREEAKTSGKTLYTLDALFLFDTSDLPGEGQNLSALTYDELKFFDSLADSLSEGYLCVREGDAMVYSLTSVVKDRSNESLSLTAVLPVHGHKTLVIPFDLEKTGEVKSWKLVPEKTELDDAGCTLLKAELRSTPLAGYIDVTFRLKPRTAVAIDGRTTVYATKMGLYYHLFEHCSGMENADAMTVNEAMAIVKQACPICLTGDRTNSSLDFELMDARGNAIGLEEFWAKHPDEDNPIPGEIFRMHGMLQPLDEAQPEYFLQPFDSDTGERFQAVRCTAQLQPKDASTPDGKW